MVRLNRAVAVGEADGPQAGLAALADVSPDLPRYAAVTAHLHERAGDLERAAELYAEASRTATSVPERDHLTRQAARVTATAASLSPTDRSRWYKQMSPETRSPQPRCSDSHSACCSPLHSPLTGCQQSERTSEEPAYPSGPVTMTAGANPGSGFDITIRAVVEALQQEQLVDVPLPVENRPGNSGADFLATMVEQYKGDDNQVSVTSLSMMMNELRGKSKYGYDDVTMIARLITEYLRRRHPSRLPVQQPR